MQLLLEKVSKNRNILMGIAMLWVVLHHCSCITNYYIPQIIKFPLLQIGYLGVDMFLFLSGFGIYYSLNKQPDNLLFILKRLKRFAPAILIFIIYFLYNKITSIHKILSFIFFQSFWVHETFGGFLSMIFIFYLISPVLKDIIFLHLYNGKRQFAFLVIILLLSLCYIGTDYMYAAARLPIYILGLIAGYNYCEKKSLNKNVIPWLLICFVIGFLLLCLVYIKYLKVRFYYGISWYPSLFFIPGLCYLLNLLIELLKKNNISIVLIKIIEIIGCYSLTIYMVDSFITKQLKIPNVLHLLLSITIGVLYGYIWEKYIDNKGLNNYLCAMQKFSDTITNTLKHILNLDFLRRHK